MSKPGKSLKRLCKKLGIRLTVKRGKKRVYKSVKVLKAQCKRKKKRKVKRRRRRKFGSSLVVGDDDNNNNNNNSTDIDDLVTRLNDLGIIAEKDDKNVNLIRIRSNTKKNKSYIIDISNKLCECPGCMFSLTCSHLKELFPGDPEIQKPYQSGRTWVSQFKKQHGREPRDSDRDQRWRTRNDKYWDWYNKMKGIDTKKIKIDEQGSSKKTRQLFGRKRKSRKKVKKEKISSSLKKLCKKHGVRLTVKRGKKRVYKSVKVLKTQCAKKSKVKRKKKIKRKRRRKFGSGPPDGYPRPIEDPNAPDPFDDLRNDPRDSHTLHSPGWSPTVPSFRLPRGSSRLSPRRRRLTGVRAGVPVIPIRLFSFGGKFKNKFQ